MHSFLNRAYRIVSNNGSEADLACTNVHACLAHIMLVSDYFVLFLTPLFCVECSWIHVKRL